MFFNCTGGSCFLDVFRLLPSADAFSHSPASYDVAFRQPCSSPPSRPGYLTTEQITCSATCKTAPVIEHMWDIGECHYTFHGKPCSLQCKPGYGVPPGQPAEVRRLWRECRTGSEWGSCGHTNDGWGTARGGMGGGKECRLEGTSEGGAGCGGGVWVADQKEGRRDRWLTLWFTL